MLETWEELCAGFGIFEATERTHLAALQGAISWDQDFPAVYMDGNLAKPGVRLDLGDLANRHQLPLCVSSFVKIRQGVAHLCCSGAAPGSWTDEVEEQGGRGEAG